MKMITLSSMSGLKGKDIENRLQQVLLKNEITKESVVYQEGIKKHFHIFVEEDKSLDLREWYGGIKVHCINNEQLNYMRKTHNPILFNQ